MEDSLRFFSDFKWKVEDLKSFLVSVIFSMPTRFGLRKELNVTNTNPWRKRRITV